MAHLHFALGNVFRALNRLDEALDSFRIAAELAPFDARPLAGLGIVYFAQDDAPAAIGYFQQAIALDPRYSTPFGQLGNAYYVSGDYAQAEGPLVRAVELERNPARLSSYHHVLGWTYLRNGALDASETQFREALALNPSLAGAVQGLEAIATLR
jgi:Flp pilus assembly protein TadD